MVAPLLVCTFLLLVANHRATAQGADGDYCNGLKPGHIMVSGFNMADPDEVVLVLLDDAPPNAVFYMTDRPWDGSAFVDSSSEGDDDDDADGTLRWSFGKQVSNFLAGREICYRCSQDGSVVDRFRPAESNNQNHNNSTFSLNAVKGDTIHLYCEEEPDSSGVSEIVHISAITTEGWAEETSTNTADTTTVDEDTSAESDTTTNSTTGGNTTDSSTVAPTTTTTTSTTATTTTITNSVLPSSLAETTFYTTLTNDFANYEYDGDTVGTAQQIRQELSDAAFWEGHADYIDNLQTQSSFKIIVEYTSGDSSGSRRTTLTMAAGAGVWCCTLASAVFSFSHMLLLY